MLAWNVRKQSSKVKDVIDIVTENVTEDDDMTVTNKVTSCAPEKYPVAILRDQLNDVGTKPSMNVRS